MTLFDDDFLTSALQIFRCASFSWSHQAVTESIAILNFSQSGHQWSVSTSQKHAKVSSTQLHEIYR